MSQPAEVDSTRLCGWASGDPHSLCNSLLAVRTAELEKDPARARGARAQLEALATAHPDWPVAWYGLGIARLAAAMLGVLSDAGPLAPAGLSGESGGAAALVRSLTLDPGFTAAGTALALAPLGREGSYQLDARITALESLEAQLSGPALLGAGLLEHEARRSAKAVEFFQRALATGEVAVGLADLALAQELYRLGRALEGRSALLAGAADTSEGGRHAYRWQLALVADPGELTAWDMTAPGERPAWLANFWARRDVQGGLPDGGRLQEHYRRLEYAFEHFRITVPQVGRSQAPGVAETVDFASRRAALDYLQHSPVMSGRDPLVEAYNQMAATINRVGELGSLLGEHTPFDSYVRTQDILDDRGIVYVRQGKPDATARTHSGEAIELWVYDRASGPLVLSFHEVNFDGQVGASRLVPTVLSANPQLRDQVCHLKPSICSATADPSDPVLIAGDTSTSRTRFMSRAQVMKRLANISFENIDQEFRESTRLSNGVAMRHEHDEGVAAIVEATSTDHAERTFSGPLHPIVQIYGLDKDPGASPRLVVVFAVPGKELEWTSPASAGGRSIYPLHLEILTASSDGAERATDTTRYFATRAPLGDGEFLSGVLEIPLPAGRHEATLVISQANGRGAVAAIGAVKLPGESEGLELSDLVLGKEGTGLTWPSGTSEVSLNPLNAYHVGGTAEVYFQIRGLRTGAEVSTTYRIFRAQDDSTRPPRLEMRTSGRASGDRWEVSRRLGLGRLKAGAYRVEVTVSDRNAQAKTVAWMTVTER
jgi:hypothetical protein